MTQQQQRQGRQDTGARDALFDGPSRPQGEPQQVRMLAGAQVQDMAIAGQTVAEARALAELVFAVDPGAQAFVDGRRVRDEHVLVGGQELEFVKRTGEKGGPRRPDPPDRPGRADQPDEAEVAALLEMLETGQLPLRVRTAIRPPRDDAPEGEQAPGRPRRFRRLGRTLSAEISGTEIVWWHGRRRMGDASLHDLMACAAEAGRARARWLVYPRGVRLMEERDDGDVVGVVIEMEPGPRQVGWLSDGSREPCGVGASYTRRRLSFPWVVLVVIFAGGELTDLQQVYYRTQALGSSEDRLYYTNLLNCMASIHGLDSKLCLRKMAGRLRHLTWEERVGRVTRHFWEASFNRSADIEARKSFFWTGGEIDPRLRDVGTWERATKDDGYFTLRLPWREAPRTLGETLEDMLDEVTPRARFSSVEHIVTALQRRQLGV